MNMIGRIARKIDTMVSYGGRIGIGCAAVAVVAMIVMNIANILLRYLFNRPQVFVVEVTGYLLIIVVFLSMAYAAQKETHVQVDLLVKRLQPRAKGAVEVLTLVATLFLLGVYFWYIWKLYIHHLRVGDTSMIVGVPLWTIHTVIWIGLLLLGSEVLVTIVKKSGALLRRSTTQGENPQQHVPGQANSG